MNVSVNVSTVTRFFARTLLVSSLGVAGFFGCSSNSASPTIDPNTQDASTTPACDPVRCKTGNECISDGSETKCRLACTSHADCPVNFQCVPGDPKSYCAENTFKPAAGATGQFGAACNPTAGLENPDCDGANGFKCYGTSPADANAFCTKFECETDLDCTANFYCGRANETPNVTTTKKSFSKVNHVCLPRTYCAPCNADFDCKMENGVPQHCVTDVLGAKYCAKECTQTSECGLWAACFDADAPTKVCVPYSGACKGDGNFCSSCRSDEDCANGTCARSEYSGERFCTQTSAVPCEVKNDKLVADCPKDPTANWKGASCVVLSSGRLSPQDFAPRNQCFGLIQMGTNEGEPSLAPGCWTRNRK